MYLFVRGNDRHVFFRVMEPYGNDDVWGAWQRMTDGTLTSGPSACADEDKIYLFVRGDDAGLYVRTMDIKGNWTPWVDLEGVIY